MTYESISEAFTNAKDVVDKPSLIILRTHIGYGSPNKQDTSEAHGSPLGAEEVKLTKKFYGWPEDKLFWVPDEVKSHMNVAIEKGKELEEKWKKKFDDYKKEYPDLAKQLNEYLQQALPEGWDNEIPVYHSYRQTKSNQGNFSRCDQCCGGTFALADGRKR